MAQKGGVISEAELDFALSVTERSVDTSPAASRFTSLCLMAVIVARYPTGDSQDKAEDRLAAAIARSNPTCGDIDVIRKLRLNGLKTDVRCPDQDRRGEPSLRKQF